MLLALLTRPTRPSLRRSDAAQAAETRLARLIAADDERTARLTELEQKVAAAQRDGDAKARAAKREAAAALEEVAVLKQQVAAEQRQRNAELDLLRVKLAQRESAIATLQAERDAAQQALARAPSVEAYERQLLTKDAEIQVLQSRLRSAETVDLLQRKVDGTRSISRTAQGARVGALAEPTPSSAAACCPPGQMEYVRQLETQNQSMKAELATLRDRLRQAAVAQEELRRCGNRWGADALAGEPPANTASCVRLSGPRRTASKRSRPPWRACASKTASCRSA